MKNVIDCGVLGEEDKVIDFNSKILKILLTKGIWPFVETIIISYTESANVEERKSGEKTIRLTIGLNINSQKISLHSVKSNFENIIKDFDLVSLASLKDLKPLDVWPHFVS